ncbi:MAG: YigZ family protein [Flavobacteriales bacterium]|nr:YigZ family protein [Flavobacteriales bacterium]
MKNSTFKTIKKSTEVLFKERGSKFIGYAYPIENEKDIKEKLDNLKIQYPDATHICYAWILGNNYRANDDGEPNNSAGQPILREIKSKELQNVLVAVVRYFGGKKLGVSGLIEAYGESAKMALETTEIIEIEPTTKFKMKELGKLDYKIYEISNRLGFEILAPANTVGDWFVCRCKMVDFESLQSSFNEMPNFELNQINE